MRLTSDLTAVASPSRICRKTHSPASSIPVMPSRALFLRDAARISSRGSSFAGVVVPIAQSNRSIRIMGSNLRVSSRLAVSSSRSVSLMHERFGSLTHTNGGRGREHLRDLAKSAPRDHDLNFLRLGCRRCATFPIFGVGIEEKNSPFGHASPCIAPRPTANFWGERRCGTHGA